MEEKARKCYCIFGSRLNLFNVRFSISLIFAKPNTEIVNGTLKGFDNILNLVLDDCEEVLRDPEDPSQLTSQTRKLGLVVCKGTALMLINPTEGSEEIANPFLQES